MDAHYPSQDHVALRSNVTLRGKLVSNYSIEIDDLFNQAG